MSSDADVSTLLRALGTKRNENSRSHPLVVQAFAGRLLNENESELADMLDPPFLVQDETVLFLCAFKNKKSSSVCASKNCRLFGKTV